MLQKRLEPGTSPVEKYLGDHQVQELEYELASKIKEIETLKQDITLLETILEKEQETSRKLLAKAHLPDSQNPDVEKLRKELEEQEMLIHGVSVLHVEEKYRQLKA